MRHFSFRGKRRWFSNATSQNNITVLFSTFTLLGSLKESFKQEEEEEKGRSVGVIVPSSLLSSLLFLPLLWENGGGGGIEKQGGTFFFLPSSNRGIPRESRPVVGVALWLWFSALCSEYTCGFPLSGKENIALVRIKTRPTRKKNFQLRSCFLWYSLLLSCFPSYGKL